MFTLGKKKRMKEDVASEFAQPVIVSSDDNLFLSEESKREKAEGEEDAPNDPTDHKEPTDLTDPKDLTDLTDLTDLKDPTDLDDSAAMMAAFEAWLEDSLPDEERREAAKSAMSQVRDSLLAGEYDEAMFDVIAKGADYPRAVEEAEIAGELRGRNAKIEELMAEGPLDDGVPHPGANGGNTATSRGYSIFDLARM